MKIKQMAALFMTAVLVFSLLPVWQLNANAASQAENQSGQIFTPETPVIPDAPVIQEMELVSSNTTRAVIGSGECGAQGDNVTWTLYDDGELVIRGSGEMCNYELFGGSLRSPWYDTALRSSINRVTIETGVNTIGDGAFDYCSSLTSVTIPESVVTIGAGAFCECSSLTSITIPRSVYTIGGYAFYCCSSLTSITIPEDVTAIGDKAFYRCTKLTSVTIPRSVTTIGNDAFSGCSSLTGITIPWGVTTIGAGAFEDCDNLAVVRFCGNAPVIDNSNFPAFQNVTATVYYPENDATWTNVVNQNYGGTLTWVPHRVFIGSGECGAQGDNVTWILYKDGELVIRGSGEMCDYELYEGSFQSPWYDLRSFVKRVTIETGVTTIGAGAFCECSKLTSVTIPEGVTTIGEGAFDGCSRLTSITIPEGVTTIGEDAFCSCDGLTSITIPESVTTIGEDAFAYCDKLTSITIPKGVTTIGERAFKCCTLLVEIKINEENPAYTDVDGVLFNKDKTTLLCYAPGKTAVSYTIPESVTTIGGYAFFDCLKLTSITIPKGVTTIGRSAFAHCDNLTSITIPEGVTTIGGYAFYSCNDLTSITIPEGVTTIGEDAFRDCDGLTSITIPESVTTIGDEAFFWCSELASITIPGSITSMGSDVFRRCYALSLVHFLGTEDQWTVISNDQSIISDVTPHYCTKVEETPSTCVETGFSAGWYCESCDEFVTGHERISGDAVTHKWETVPGKAPTCTDTGLTDGVKCSVCGEILTPQTEIPVADHNYVSGSCTVCGKECGHSYREEVITAPDCETDGVVVYTCSECGDSYTQTTTASGHSYDAVVTEPTCTEGGYTTYTCTVCGNTYTADEIASPGHSYANGACTVCGAADPDYNPITVPTLTAKNISLSFEDEILVNVYFTAADTADVENYGLLLFSEKVATPTFDTAIAHTEGWYESNGYLGVTTPGIATKNMGDTLYFAVYAVLADGSYAYTKTYSYAPATYAYNMLGKTSTSDGMKSLIVAMLNYGAAAQEYFGYNTDNLVNANLTDEQKALVTGYNADMLDGLATCTADKKGDLFGSGNTGFTKRTPSVNFEGAFSVNFYFSQPKATVGSDVTFYVWDKATYESVDTLLPENAVATSTCTFDGTYYAGIVEGITAKQVDETFYCAAVFTCEDGNTYVSGVISYSLGYYLENQAAGTAMPDFAQATGVYAYYAKTLFNA